MIIIIIFSHVSYAPGVDVETLVYRRQNEDVVGSAYTHEIDDMQQQRSVVLIVIIIISKLKANQ